jgi:hypothetical protein
MGLTFLPIGLLPYPLQDVGQPGRALLVPRPNLVAVLYQRLLTGQAHSCSRGVRHPQRIRTASKVSLRTACTHE